MKRVFVDTSAWYGLANAKDSYHEQARDFIKNLADDILLITSITVVAEFLSVLRVRIGVKESIYAQELLLGESPHVIEMHSQDDFQHAAALFKNTPRQASFVDCLIVATMQRLGIKELFTYDSWFKTQNINTVG